MNKDYSKLIKKNKYQIFIFTCPANIPVNFAIHPWIVTNEKGKLTRFDVCHFKNKDENYLHIDHYSYLQGIEVFPNIGKWYWKGELFYKAQGDFAKKMITFIKKSKDNYPYLKKYSLFGPNSNTYVKWVLDHFPSIKKELPWNGVGKNYHRRRK